MKKIIHKIALVATVTAVAGYGVYNSQKQEVTLSETALANVEALANDEYGDRDDCISHPYDTCDMFVIYGDGDWGLDMLLQHTKKTGWG